MLYPTYARPLYGTQRTDVAKVQSEADQANAKADEKQKQVQAEAAQDREDAQVKAAKSD
jgi:hypothetical protein